MVQQDSTPSADAQGQPWSILKNMLDGMRISRAIHVAAEFGIADLLKDGPQNTAELAINTKTHEKSLYRLLRALASVNIFQEVEPRCFAQTPLSALLQSDHPDTMRDLALMLGDAWQWQTWGEMAKSIRTGEPAFDLTFGMDVWSYFSTVNPASGKIFNRAMTAGYAMSNLPIAQAYDFSQAQTLVDIGGGQGNLIETVLSLYPDLHGVLFDRPEVIASGGESIEAEVKDRLTSVGGDFFQAVPPGGDIYLMRQILHDWDDDACAQILQNCRKVINPGGHILVIERLVKPGGLETSAEKFVDLHMMINQPGSERSEAEFAALYERSGFKLNKVYPTHSSFFILEGVVEVVSELRCLKNL
jgi:hypothetical protein